MPRGLACGVGGPGTHSREKPWLPSPLPGSPHLKGGLLMFVGLQGSRSPYPLVPGTPPISDSPAIWPDPLWAPDGLPHFWSPSPGSPHAACQDPRQTLPARLQVAHGSLAQKLPENHTRCQLPTRGLPPPDSPTFSIGPPAAPPAPLLSSSQAGCRPLSEARTTQQRWVLPAATPAPPWGGWRGRLYSSLMVKLLFLGHVCDRQPCVPLPP